MYILKLFPIASSVHIDNELLTRIKNGDERAFEQLYKKHSIALLQIAYRKTGVLEIAEELIQDTFLSFYIRSQDVKDHPLLYLKTILKFKVLDYVKTKKEIYFSGLDPTTQLESTGSLYEKIDAKEAHATIYGFITQLPEQCRKVFLLSREANKSNKEIAEKLGISVKAVEAHITKALKYLREHIDYHALWILTLPLLTHSL